MPGAPKEDTMTEDTTPAHRYTAALAEDIERRWQDRWDAEGTFAADNPAGSLALPLRPDA